MTDKEYPPEFGLRLLDKLYEAGLIPSKTVRVIIDAHCQEPLRIYVEQIGSTKDADVICDAVLDVIKPTRNDGRNLRNDERKP